MRNDNPQLSILRQPAVQIYMLLCFGALAVLTILHAIHDNMLLGALIFLVGLLGLISRISAAPVLVLGVLALGEMRLWEFFPYRLSPYETFLAAIAVLTYTVCFFRYLGLVHNIFPRDPRLREAPAPGEQVSFRWRTVLLFKRSPELVTPLEFVVALMSVPICATIALYVRYGLARAGELNVFGALLPSYRYRAAAHFLSQAVVLCFIGFVAILVVDTILWYWRLQRLSSKQSAMMMQDVVWNETRRELRRIQRWRTRRRILQMKGKE